MNPREWETQAEAGPRPHAYKEHVSPNNQGRTHFFPPPLRFLTERKDAGGGERSCDRQQVAKLCFLGRPPSVPLYLPFSPCPLFFLKGSDFHLNPRRLISLRRRKPSFSLLLIWPRRRTLRCLAHRSGVLWGLLAR